MINVLKRLAELDAKNPNIAKPVLRADKSLAEISETPKIVSEGVRLPNISEPDLAGLRTLAGTRQLNESTVAEYGMGMPMAPAVPQMPATINMSAGSANEIVSMFRGIMDLAKSDGIPTQAAYPGMGAPMPSLTPPMGGMEEPADPVGLDRDGDGDHDIGDHSMEPIDDTGGDELADMMKKLQTGEPVKIKTDMPVKVSTDDDVTATTDKEVTSTDDNMNKKEEGNAFSGALAQAKAGGEDDFKVGDKKFDVESYANSPEEKTKGYNPNDFANIINKVRSADLETTPYGSASNPMPNATDEEERMGESVEDRLMAEYKAFMAEGEKTMSRAAKGMMKYGKKGMKELADAGKKGKDLEPIRAKYNKYD